MQYDFLHFQTYYFLNFRKIIDDIAQASHPTLIHLQQVDACPFFFSPYKN